MTVADPVPARRLRVVVVDDHHLFRAGVKAELMADCDVVGEAAAPPEAIATIDATSPDVVLLDVHIPDGGGVAVLRALQGSETPPAVLALSVSDAAEDVVPMIKAGALGYVTKTIDAAELIAAIERVAAGTPTSARGWPRSCSRSSRLPSRHAPARMPASRR